MKKHNENQGQLLKKVVNISDVKPAAKGGQQQLFGTVEEFAPGFQEWAGLMNQKFVQSEEENNQLKQEIKENTAQSKRLANSLERIIPKFEDMSVNGNNADLVVSPYQEHSMADVALVDSTLPSEAYYPYTTSDLSQLIGMHPARLGTLFTKSGIKGDPKFHCALKTGLKGVCQKYKMSALNELRNRAINFEFNGLKTTELEKLENYFKIKEQES